MQRVAGPEGQSSSDIAEAKVVLRRQMLAARSAMSASEIAAAAEAIASVVLAMPEVTSAQCVASYVSVGREPGTRGLLDALVARGVRVLVPVLLPDNDLDWAEYAGPDALAPAGRGLLEPTGRRLGRDAVGRADAVLVPALAVDLAGNRLGRGGGSYDRALARTGDATLTVALLYDHELLAPDRAVPTAALDRPVAATARPAGLSRLGPGPAT